MNVGPTFIIVGCAPYPSACPDSAGLPLTLEGHRKKINTATCTPSTVTWWLWPKKE